MTIKRLFSWLAVIVSVPIGMCLVLLTFVVYQERDVTFLGRIYLARHEIAAMQGAVEAFYGRNGSYPLSLQQLVQSDTDGGGESPLLRQIRESPWGTTHSYRVIHNANASGIKIWIVPDQKTRSKANVTELSNETDWEEILK
jgi:hypothetical protein